MTTVAWMNWDEAVPNRGYWDMGLLERMFDKDQQVDALEGLDGAVVVIPARYHVDKAELINEELARLKWAVVILTSDEESLFPWRELEHPNMKLWVQTPHPERHAGCDAVFIGEGYNEDCPDILLRFQGSPRIIDWYFSGQVTHERRVECVEVLRTLPFGLLNETAGFTQGFEYSEYLRRMASAKIAIAPSGPATPCSFRVHEGLEAGCVPIVDASSPGHPDGYWDLVYPDRPFPVVQHWSEAPEVIGSILDDWEEMSAICSEWWADKKAGLRRTLDAQVEELTGG